MAHPLSRSWSRLALLLLLVTLGDPLLGALDLLPEAAAQRRPKITQIVIMNVPRGGTRELAEALSSLDDAALFPQRWFDEQADERGFDPEGILDRPEDLAWVMKGAEVDLIVRLRYSSQRELYRVDLITPAEGMAEYSFEIDGSDSGLDAEGAEQIQREIFDFLGSSNTSRKPRVEDPDDLDGMTDGDDDDESFDPNSLRDQAIANQKKPPRSGGGGSAKGAAQIRAGFRLIEPSLLVTGGNLQSFAISSGATSGFGISADILPMALAGGGSSPEANSFGISLQYSQVFSKIQFTPFTADPNALPPAPAPIGISFLDFDAGVFYGQTAAPGGPDSPTLRGKLLLRLNKFNISQPVVEARPFGFFSIVLGADAIFPLGTSGAKILTSVELAPFAKPTGEAWPVFGATSYAYSLGGTLGFAYDFTPNLGFTASYIFDTYRILFAPNTELGSTPKSVFTAAGLFAGIQYTY